MKALSMPVSRLLPRRIADLRKSAFVKNVLLVMSGTAAGQAIGFALTPVISRLFSPSDFGVFGSFTSLYVIFSGAATMQYSQAIVLPKEKDDAVYLFFVSCLSTLAVGFLCLLFCLIVPGYVNRLMKTDGFWALGLLVAATVVAGFNQTLQAWSVSVKAFKHTSASQLLRSLSSNGSQVGLGYLGVGAPGLIVSSVLADIAASINLARLTLPDIFTANRTIKWSRIKQLAKDYRDFPMYSGSQNIVWALSTGMPVLLLAHFYGLVVAGAYAFGMRVIQTPMSLVTGALRQVLFQRAAETRHHGGLLLPLYLKTVSGLFALAVFPSLILFIWAPQLFSLIFGSHWHIAGEFVQILILWLLISFCTLPAGLFSGIIRVQKTFFQFELVKLAASASTLFVGGLYLSASHTIILFSIVGAILNAAFILVIGLSIRKRECQVDEAELEAVLENVEAP